MLSTHGWQRISSKATSLDYGHAVAGYDLRIVFEFSKQNDEEIILLVSVGTHDEVY